MKNIYTFLFAVLLLSCSKEEARIVEKSHIINPSFNVELMIGSWAYESIIQNGVEYKYSHKENCTKDIFAFYNSEGKLHDYVEEIKIYDHCASQSTNMEWFVNQDQIELFFGTQFVMAFKVLSVNETEFIVETSLDGSEDRVIIKAIRHDPYGWFETE